MTDVVVKLKASRYKEMEERLQAALDAEDPKQAVRDLLIEEVSDAFVVGYNVHKTAETENSAVQLAAKSGITCATSLSRIYCKSRGLLQ